MDQIIILDFGNEYNVNLVDLIKDQNLEVQLLPYDTKARDLKNKENLIGLILSGSYTTVKEDDLEAFDGEILDLDIPILGLGRGMQVIINELGGTVTAQESVYEPTDCQLKIHNTKDGIFEGFQEDITEQIGFDAAVSKLPEGFTVLANGQEKSSGDDRPFGAMENPQRQIYGIQFITRPGENKDHEKALVNFIDMCK